MSDPFDQSLFDVRCDWGEHGLRALAGSSDVVIVVDVLSFSTCVDVATARGARIFPRPSGDDSTIEFAERIGAELAGRRGEARYSLSPASFLDVGPDTKVVLPSPNGATLTLAAGNGPVVAGCLRNASAVAAAARAIGNRVAVIAAGERWRDGSLRPSIEDWLGAGALIARLSGSLSPEARAAARSWQACAGEIASLLLGCASGRELIDRGYERDVTMASDVDASGAVPTFDGMSYRDATGGPVLSPRGRGSAATR